MSIIEAAAIAEAITGKRPVRATFSVTGDEDLVHHIELALNVKATRHENEHGVAWMVEYDRVQFIVLEG